MNDIALSAETETLETLDPVKGEESVSLPQITDLPSQQFELSDNTTLSYELSPQDTDGATEDVFLTGANDPFETSPDLDFSQTTAGFDTSDVDFDVADTEFNLSTDDISFDAEELETVEIDFDTAEVGVSEESDFGGFVIADPDTLMDFYSGDNEVTFSFDESIKLEGLNEFDFSKSLEIYDLLESDDITFSTVAVDWDFGSFSTPTSSVAKVFTSGIEGTYRRATFSERSALSQEFREYLAEAASEQAFEAFNTLRSFSSPYGGISGDDVADVVIQALTEVAFQKGLLDEKKEEKENSSSNYFFSGTLHTNIEQRVEQIVAIAAPNMVDETIDYSGLKMFSNPDNPLSYIPLEPLLDLARHRAEFMLGKAEVEFIEPPIDTIISNSDGEGVG